MKPKTEFILDDEWKEVAACVDEYERESHHALPDLRVVLDRVSPRNTSAALRELVMTDVEHRWRRSQQKPVDAYLREFDELNEDVSFVAELNRVDEAARKSAMDATISSSQMPAMQAPDDTSNPAGRLTLLEESQADIDTVQDIKPTDMVGGYALCEKLGSGSFGVVYRATHPETDEQVAVKVAHTRKMGIDMGQMARHEARGVARLLHPNIVPLLASGALPDGRPYLIYQYVPGTTLDDRLEAGDTSRKTRLKWIAQLAEALHHAHTSGLVHRDVKPTNVLIDNQGKPWITDFGLAKIDDDYVADDTGTTLGTVSYMSPEQASGKSHWATPQSDVYALGVMLYEVICGRRPFVARNSRELLKQICDRHPTAPRSIRDDIPEDLESVCLKAIAKDPAQRIQTAADFAAAIRKYLKPSKFPSGWLAPLTATAATSIIAAAAILAPRFFPQESSLVASPSNAPAPEATLQIHFQAVERADRGFGFLDASDLPLSPGDRLQVRTDLNVPAHIYMFACRDSGQLKLVSSSSSEEGEAIARQKSFFPPREDQWITMPEEEGVMLFAIGASNQPLEQAALDALSNQRFALPSPSSAPMILRVAEPWPAAQEQLPSTTRSLSKGDPELPIETVPTYTLPAEIQDSFRNTFDAFHIVMITHQPNDTAGE